jgi:tripartite-type tricarboxylate transporter receptor subunit TctC
MTLNTPPAAQSAWPSKTIRFVVPFAPGGTSEIVARSVATELTRQLGQSVYVENKPGGAGVVAMSDVAKAAPDGHTLILGHVGTLAVNPYMLSHSPYDVNRDFMPVTLLAKVPNVFVIHPDVPARDFREFVAYVRKNPGKLNYGSAGNASLDVLVIGGGNAALCAALTAREAGASVLLLESAVRASGAAAIRCTRATCAACTTRRRTC